LCCGPILSEQIKAANSAAANGRANVGHFARGLVMGEPDRHGRPGRNHRSRNLFVFGDLRATPCAKAGASPRARRRTS